MPGHRKLGSQSVPKSGSDKRKELTATPIDAPARSGPPLQRPPPLIQSPDDSSLPPFLSQHGSPHHAGKMAIPRLKRNCDGPSTTGPTNSSENKHRVSHACEPCRQRKTKCSGERPICKHCEDFAINCLYEDGKRDRTKKYATPASFILYKRINEKQRVQYHGFSSIRVRIVAPGLKRSCGRSGSSYDSEIVG